MVIAQTDPEFYRRLHSIALEVFPAAKRYYHITPDLKKYPDVKDMEDGDLEKIFENPDARQVLHVTYGELLRNRDLRDEIYRVLDEHIEEYWKSLEDHIGKHLEYLGIKTVKEA